MGARGGVRYGRAVKGVLRVAEEWVVVEGRGSRWIGVCRVGRRRRERWRRGGVDWRLGEWRWGCARVRGRKIEKIGVPAGGGHRWVGSEVALWLKKKQKKEGLCGWKTGASERAREKRRV